MDAPEVREPPHELPRDLVFVDLETTGGNAAYHRIIEIGIVRMQQGAAVEEWSSLVNPECPVPSYIENFTGIGNEMVASAPRFADIARLVLEKLKSPGSASSPPPIFVAHNARFDYAFLRAEFRRAGLHFSAKVLCTVKLSRRLFPEHVRHNLDAIMERHAIACSARHRALGDARVIGDFWRKLERELPPARLAAAAQSLLGAKLPAYLPEGLAEELPEGPGIYRLYGADDALLYVGRGASVRAGVLGHFAEDRPTGKGSKLKHLVRRVEWEETTGELGALLRELDCIRNGNPLHNRRLKPVADSFTLEVAEDTGAVAVLVIADVEATRLAGCFGVFHARSDALKALRDIARAHSLCPKVMGLEQSEGSCLGHQVGRCKGACVGKEPLILHAVRVQLALASLKLKAWPFPGRVALRERGSLGGGDLHVLDHWGYLGTARSDEELSVLAMPETAPAFDAQVYRILVRYFASHPKLDWHDLEVRRPVST
jgi:DNA polymerase-3 subunit epsilon